MKYTEEQIKQELVRQYTEEGLRFYKPSPKQELLHRSTAKIRAAFAGNQWGKTFWGCVEIALTIGKCHPWRKNYIGRVFARDCCVNFNTIKTNLVEKYRTLLPRSRCKLGWKTFEGHDAVWPGLRGGAWDKAYNASDQAIYLEDGSFIEFKTYEQGREALQGPQRHIIRHDEEPPNEDLFDENLARQSAVKEGWNVLFTLTPLNYSQWLYQRIWLASLDDDSIFCIKARSRENPYANQESIDLLEASMTDEAAKAARLEGEFTVTAGRVYPMYGDGHLYDPFKIPNEWHKTIIIDPHPQKPTAVNWIAEDFDGCLWCYREADLIGEAEDMADEIISLSGSERIDLKLIDPSSRQRAGIRGDDKPLADKFRKKLGWIHYADNDVQAGIDSTRERMRTDMGAPRLRVSRDCPVTHAQLMSLMWKPPTKTGEDRTKPQVFKKSDDHPDNVRYRCHWRGGAPMRVSNNFAGFNMTGYAS